MAKGKRTSEEAKRRVAQRIANGEEIRAIAEELGMSVYTIGEWGRQYKPKPRKVKRKVSISPPNTQNTRVSDLEKENAELRMELEVWKGAYKAITNRK